MPMYTNCLPGEEVLPVVDEVLADHLTRLHSECAQPGPVLSPQNCGFCDCFIGCQECQAACLAAGGWDDGDGFCSGGDVRDAPLKCSSFGGSVEYDGTQYCGPAPPPPVSGCTNADSQNYDPTAATDDGSCTPWSLTYAQSCGFCDCCADCSGCQAACVLVGGWDDGDTECTRADMEARVDTTHGGTPTNKCRDFGGSIWFSDSVRVQSCEGRAPPDASGGMSGH